MDPILFDEMAALEETYWWFVARRRILLSLIDRYVLAQRDRSRLQAQPRRPKACDIGCGCGSLLQRLADRFDAVGLEYDPVARAYAQKRGLTVRPCVLPDDVPIEPASQDLIVMTDVLEHLDDDRGSVAAAVERLRGGGWLLCTVPAHPWMWSKRDEFHHHRRRYTKQAYRALFAGLPLRQRILGYYNSVLFPLMAGARLAKKLSGRDRAAADIRPLPGPLNWLMTQSFAVERAAIGRLPLPPGGSLLSLHQKDGVMR